MELVEYYCYFSSYSSRIPFSTIIDAQLHTEKLTIAVLSLFSVCLFRFSSKRYPTIAINRTTIEAKGSFNEPYKLAFRFVEKVSANFSELSYCR